MIFKITVVVLLLLVLLLLASIGSAIDSCREYLQIRDAGTMEIKDLRKIKRLYKNKSKRNKNWGKVDGGIDERGRDIFLQS